MLIGIDPWWLFNSPNCSSMQAYNRSIRHLPYWTPGCHYASFQSGFKGQQRKRRNIRLHDAGLRRSQVDSHLHVVFVLIIIIHSFIQPHSERGHTGQDIDVLQQRAGINRSRRGRVKVHPKLSNSRHFTRRDFRSRVGFHYRYVIIDCTCLYYGFVIELLIIDYVLAIV